VNGIALPATTTHVAFTFRPSSHVGGWLESNSTTTWDVNLTSADTVTQNFALPGYSAGSKLVDKVRVVGLSALASSYSSTIQDGGEFAVNQEPANYFSVPRVPLTSDILAPQPEAHNSKARLGGYQFYVPEDSPHALSLLNKTGGALLLQQYPTLNGAFKLTQTTDAAGPQQVRILINMIVEMTTREQFLGATSSRIAPAEIVSAKACLSHVRHNCDNPIHPKLIAAYKSAANFILNNKEAIKKAADIGWEFAKFIGPLALKAGGSLI